MKRYLIILPVLLSLLVLVMSSLLLAGCGVTKHFSGERAVVTPYDTNCLWNLQQGRDYAAQGRYELAKEHLVMALAASNDPETRRIIAHELQSTDMMIQSQR